MLAYICLCSFVVFLVLLSAYCPASFLIRVLWMVAFLVCIFYRYFRSRLLVEMLPLVSMLLRVMPLV